MQQKIKDSFLKNFYSCMYICVKKINLLTLYKSLTYLKNACLQINNHDENLKTEKWKTVVAKIHVTVYKFSATIFPSGGVKLSKY